MLSKAQTRMAQLFLRARLSQASIACHWKEGHDNAIANKVRTCRGLHVLEQKEAKKIR